MSECQLNHSAEDVKNKYEQQKEHLPSQLQPLMEEFLQKEHTQEILNDVFHLLKKYDLASEDEKEERERRLYLVVNNV
ncbi:MULTISPECIES: hypothetical protein [Bacillaceae]|uniref:Group-specific protein n=2 Tax=Bacillus infantis TaxID=324767 RepID=U5LBL3_9BACI|nr:MULTISPECIES: hypothetical protein [Bacillus]OXT18431.1 group-specific protein [Bacillus sp. OG2]AGX04116.1 hypothetical protein N288_11020 [Bacillus infantis NRRL B-14911]EAR63388.1 group-specific protein [Bacillus sp. NRRL B-14911]MCA1036737.1 group-specific protein [Bacillus infantis]MCK6206841.1 group-specific protein [Bacillus infantis]